MVLEKGKRGKMKASGGDLFLLIRLEDDREYKVVEENEYNSYYEIPEDIIDAIQYGINKTLQHYDYSLKGIFSLDTVKNYVDGLVEIRKINE